VRADAQIILFGVARLGRLGDRFADQIGGSRTLT